MKDTQKIEYRNWYIVPIAIPQADGKWSANCHIENIDAHGISDFQDALGVVVRDKKDEAISAACEDARRHIDAIIADPLWKHPSQQPDYPHIR